MRATVLQAGARVSVECRPPRIARLIEQALGPSLLLDTADDDPDVDLVISADGGPFDLEGWAPLTRGAYHLDGQVVLLNACGSGFDLRVTVAQYPPYAKVRVEARYRPPLRERTAAALMPSRFHLLARAALLQYPAMWVAGTRGRVPLHAGAVTIGDGVALLAGPGGVGRSTLLLGALDGGERACSDNLCVSDGQRVHGVVEPVRIEGAPGRRMPHGRGECILPNRVDVLVPDRLVVLRRMPSGRSGSRPLKSEAAARVLSAGTYMAGELRRYWAFAATVSMGTGRGPVHPSVAEVAREFARLPAVEITLGEPRVSSLVDLLDVLQGAHQ
jgi:hypothetical protein